MYEDFRLNLMRELLSDGLDDVTMARVMGIVSRIEAYRRTISNIKTHH